MNEKPEKDEGTVKTTQAKPAVNPPAQPKPPAPPPEAPPAGNPAASKPPTEAAATKPAPERQTWEQWAKAKRVAAAELRTAKTLHRWPVGKQLTEAEFDAALVAARNLVFR